MLSGNNTSEDFITNLFESGYFLNVSLYFFNTMMPSLNNIEDPDSILGIMVGLSTKNS